MNEFDVPLHPGVASLADGYDGFIVDLYGVLHDGVTPYPGAVDCLRRLRRAGKRVLVLSNAPRRATEVARQSAAIGIVPEYYDVLWSSGEEAWRHLRHGLDSWHRDLGDACFHLGPDRNQGLTDDLPHRQVDAPEQADFVLNTGAHMPEEAAARCLPVLERAAGLGLPMVCANPDLVVIHGGRREICAGTLALYYEEMGGQVRYHGKPHRPIYETCFELLGLDDRDRIAGVGAALATDIAGAVGAGIAGIFVAGGIHKDELTGPDGALPDSTLLRRACAAAGIRPTAALAAYTW